MADRMGRGDPGRHHGIGNGSGIVTIVEWKARCLNISHNARGVSTIAVTTVKANGKRY